MGKCNRCGRHGLFVKVADGLCANCQATLKMESEQKAITEKMEADRSAIKAEMDSYSAILADQKLLYEDIKTKAILEATSVATKQCADLEQRIAELTVQSEARQKSLDEVTANLKSTEKTYNTNTEKIKTARKLLQSIKHAQQEFDATGAVMPVYNALDAADNWLSPEISIPLQCMNMANLRKLYRKNEKQIQDTLERYRGRYTTKANMAIYSLMVIALEAELQNVLFNLRYGKLEDACENIHNITKKYYAIAAEGNQSIAPTIKKFIGEIDFFFEEAIKIEYEYYVQKERAKEEQKALREQMRQEAAERKELERQQKQIEAEESKFKSQIELEQEKLKNATDDDAIAALNARIAELQSQLSNVETQKDKITSLQNGKAGNVYIISNIGSFGEDVYKVGMTRRLVPQERVDELGDASVPFPFDVHAMIFSDDAPTLETTLHRELNEKRVNKVNLRKEFFRVSVDEIEALVFQYAPTAEFTRTALAEQYRQSLSIDVVDDTVVADDDSDDTEEA